MELTSPRKKDRTRVVAVAVAVAAESPNDGATKPKAKATEEMPTATANGTQQGDTTRMDSDSSRPPVATATTTEPEPETTRCNALNEEGQETGNAKTEAESESQAAMPLSLSDQDLAVYGNLNARLADVFTEGIEAAISKGVDSLPLLDDGGDDCYRGKSSPDGKEDNEAVSTGNTKSPKQRLWDALRYRFVRNVDVLEAYCAHHVLTLRKHPPARRKRIVAVLRDGIDALPSLPSKGAALVVVDADVDVDVDDEKANKETERETCSKVMYPTRSELPSEEETKDLSEELSRLQARLESAKQKRNALLASVESANRAEQAVSVVVATIEDNLPAGLEHDAIRSDVSEKVQKGNTVSLLADEAKSLVGKLDGIKRDRSNNYSQNNKDGGGGDGFDFVQRDDPLHKASHRIGTNKRQKPLSLEEAYRRDRRELGLLRDSTNNNENDRNTIGIGSSGPSLSVFRSMLMVPPSSTISSSLQPPPSTPTN